MDSLKNVKMLEKAGLDRNIAEACVTVWDESIQSHFATKEDIKDLRQEFKLEMNRLELRLGEKMASLRDELKGDMASLRGELKSLESSLLIRMGAMQVAGLGIIAGLIKFL